MEGFVEAEAECEADADGDRHVHVGVPVPQHAPGGSEEDTSGIGQRRQRDQRGQPMEQVARGAVRTGPDRDRQQHDVAGGKTCDRKRTDQFGERCVLRIGPDVVEMRLVADVAQRRDEWRRHLGRPADGGALAGQVDAGGIDAGQGLKRGLDAMNAAAAVNARHRQVGLPDAVADGAARQPDFFGAAIRIEAESDVTAGRATTHQRSVPSR